MRVPDPLVSCLPALVLVLASALALVPAPVGAVPPRRASSASAPPPPPPPPPSPPPPGLFPIVWSAYTWLRTVLFPSYPDHPPASLVASTPLTSESVVFAPALGVHVGGGDHDGLLAWSDLSTEARAASQPLAVRSRPARYRRLRSPEKFAYPRAYGDWDQVLTTSQCLASPSGAGWEDVTVRAPNVTDRETLLSLVRMAAHAYQPGNETWVPDTGGFNQSLSFGWDSDGIRGHVFADAKNETVVVAIKGTTAAFMPGGGGDTAKRDKMNDNLLFSCCCARVSWTWTTVCGCYKAVSGSKGCGQSCVEGALLEKSFYYRAATELYSNVTRVFPNAQIWLTGHSLGGALSSLIGMTYGLPTVAFESPGERMAARRLHLPVPGDYPASTRGSDDSGLPIEELPIVHVYHTADPLALGQCVGQMSPCGQFGYAMESRCHAGQSIVYDTVKLLGWSPSLLTHRVITLTDDLLLTDWDERVKESGGQAIAMGAQDKRPPSDSFLGWRWPWPWNPPDDSDSSGDQDSEPEPEPRPEPEPPGRTPGGDDSREYDGPTPPGLPDPDRDGDADLPVPRARYEHDCEDCTGWQFSDHF